MIIGSAVDRISYNVFGAYHINLTRSQSTHHTMKLRSICRQELEGVEVAVAGAVTE